MIVDFPCTELRGLYDTRPQYKTIEKGLNTWSRLVARVQMSLSAALIVLCLASFGLAIGTESCFLCLSHKEPLVVSTQLAPLHQYELILEYGNQLCNKSFGVTQLRNCIARAEQYAHDRVKDLYSEAERHQSSVTISLDNMCEVLAACATSCCLSQWDPEQVHISFGGDNSMIVMWVTQNELGTPSVAYWPNLSGNVKQNAAININFSNATTYTYDSTEWLGYIYTANLTNLSNLTSYDYQLCGSTSNGFACFPTIYNFTAPPVASTAPLTARFTSSSLLPYIPGETAAIACIFGDVSTEVNAVETASSIVTLRKNTTIQLVVNAGDLAYADGAVSIWDEYFRMIEDFAAYIPVMTAPGNHENYYNFASYYARFTMPVASSNSPSKQYYSFNYEKIHYVSFSVEEDDGASLLPGAPQRVWLENDLAQANTERDVRPWIILFGHRPFYCSSDSNDCTDVASKLRELLEGLINQYHVDVVISGHKHNYERTYPVYQSEATSNDYNDPAAPVYYVVGTGGVDKNSDFVDPEPSWSADRDDKYGYLFASAPDSNTLQLYYLSKSFNVHDSATIQRTTVISTWSFTH